MAYNYPQMPTGSIAQEPLVNPPAGAQMPGAQAGFQQPQSQNQYQQLLQHLQAQGQQQQAPMGNQYQQLLQHLQAQGQQQQAPMGNQYQQQAPGGQQGNIPQELQTLLGQFMQQAQPQLQQPEEWPQAAGDAQMQHLNSLLPGEAGAFGPIEEEEMKRFREEILPGIRQQFSSQGRSSAQDQMELRGAQDLSQRLSAQRAGREGQRSGQLGQFLGGQQKIGMGQQELGIRGMGQTANTDVQGYQAMLDALGKQTGYGTGQGNTIQRDPVAMELAKALAPFGGQIGQGIGTGVGAGASALEKLLSMFNKSPAEGTT